MLVSAYKATLLVPYELSSQPPCIEFSLSTGFLRKMLFFLISAKEKDFSLRMNYHFLTKMKHAGFSPCKFQFVN